MKEIAGYTYTEEQLSDMFMEAYNAGKRDAKCSYMRKQKERIRNIKFTMCLGIVTVGFPLLMVLHWIAYGY